MDNTTNELSNKMDNSNGLNTDMDNSNGLNTDMDNSNELNTDMDNSNGIKTNMDNSNGLNTDMDNSNGLNKNIEYLMNKVGGGGLAQWKMMILLWIIYFAAACPLFIHKFAGHVPSHRCRVPICEGYNKNPETWQSFALPVSSSSTEIWLHSNYSSCFMYDVDPNSTKCEPESFRTNDTIPCESWIYGSESEPDIITLSTQMNLVCNEDHKNDLLDMLLILGILFGSLIGGKCGDYFGRKITISGAVVITIPALIVGGFPGYYEVYALCRFITGGCMVVLWNCVQCVIVEFITPEKREAFIAVKDLFFPINQMLLAGIAYLTKENYAYLHLTIGLICLLSLIACFFIPESVRWGIIHGLEDKSKETLTKMAKTNGKTLTEEDLKEISLVFSHIAKNSEDDDHSGNFQFWHLFEKSQLQKTLILAFNWITVAVGYYTINLNNTKLAGNIYLNFGLSNFVVLIFTYVLFVLIKKFSRRFNLFLYQFIMGTSAIALGFIPLDMKWLIIIVYITGKVCAGAGFLMVWLLPAEMYPTNLRAQALGTFSTIARIFSIAAAYVTNLTYYWRPLPMIVIGIPCILAGCTTYFLHETSGLGLPQTMKESKKMEYDQRSISSNTNEAYELE